MMIGKISGRIRVSLLPKKEKPPGFRVVLFSYELAINYLNLVGRAGLEPATP